MYRLICGFVLTIVPAELGDLVARLRGSVLYVDPTADPDVQLDAIADAVAYRRTGRAEHGRRVHMQAVASA